MSGQMDLTVQKSLVKSCQRPVKGASVSKKACFKDIKTYSEEMDHTPAQGQGNKPGRDQQTSYSHWQQVSGVEKNHLEGLPAISEK